MQFRNYITDLRWSDFQAILLGEESQVQKNINYATFCARKKGK